MALRPVYSVQLISLAPCLPENTVTVPDGSRIILRDIDLIELSGAGATIFQVWNAAGGLLWYVEGGTTVPSTVFQWRGRQVFNPGESIVFKPISGTWDVQASGYELTLT